ncbi:MAG: isocitrate lyase/PEP mutase family protein [Rubrivivax sp.]|nr:isocitrate lyase/PEP mutase family protein [Rubrivivax sp.]
MPHPHPARALREQIKSGRTIWTAGAYDALSARMIERAGFDAVFTTGFGISASHLGQPDVELYTMTENLGVVRHMVSSVGKPVIADGDTGYGNVINVMRTVREFERAGVGGIVFEDQVIPKRCPCATANIDVLPREDAVKKIRAAVDARSDPDFVIVARTDAPTVEETIARAKLYAEAGADLIQPISRTMKNFADLQRLREACGRPLSLQILGWLEKELTPQQIEQVAGLAVFPLVPLMTVAAAMEANLARLAADHHARNLPLPQTGMEPFKALIGFDEVERVQEHYDLR